MRLCRPGVPVEATRRIGAWLARGGRRIWGKPRSRAAGRRAEPGSGVGPGRSVLHAPRGAHAARRRLASGKSLTLANLTPHATPTPTLTTSYLLLLILSSIMVLTLMFCSTAHHVAECCCRCAHSPWIHQTAVDKLTIYAVLSRDRLRARCSSHCSKKWWSTASHALGTDC